MSGFGTIKQRFDIPPKDERRHDHWISTSEQDIFDLRMAGEILNETRRIMGLELLV
jgi:hypothetical protein